MYSAIITSQSDTPNEAGNYTYGFDVLLNKIVVNSSLIDSLSENVLTNIQVYLDSLAPPIAKVPNLVGKIVEASNVNN